jgi:hypothetical protein
MGAYLISLEVIYGAHFRDMANISSYTRTIHAQIAAICNLEALV